MRPKVSGGASQTASTHQQIYYNAGIKRNYPYAADSRGLIDHGTRQGVGKLSEPEARSWPQALGGAEYRHRAVPGDDAGWWQFPIRGLILDTCMRPAADIACVTSSPAAAKALLAMHGLNEGGWLDSIKAQAIHTTNLCLAAVTSRRLGVLRVLRA